MPPQTHAVSLRSTVSSRAAGEPVRLVVQVQAVTRVVTSQASSSPGAR